VRHVKTNLKELASGEPKLAELLEDYRYCLQRVANPVTDRQRLNYETRYNIWPGQTSDGRKWTPPNGQKEVWPWKGASDSRPHLVDTYIREDVAKLMVAWRRMKILVNPTESNDDQFSTRVTQLLRWLKYTQMKEASGEAELAAQWALERGSVVIGCWWQKQMQLGYAEIDMETIQTRAAMARKAQEAGQLPDGWTEEQLKDAAEAVDVILDPSQESHAVEIFGRYYDDVKRAAAVQAVKDLRNTGHARFPRPYLVKNRPCVGARALNEEIFVPQDAADFETTRSVYERELLTEALLRERVVSLDWDKAWVDEVIATQKGVVSSGLNLAAQERWTRRTNGLSTLNVQKLYEVMHAYRRLSDDAGVLGIYYTVFHAGMANSSTRRQKGSTYGYHGLLNYDHGAMPFTLWQTERRSRLVGESRGYGEVASTWQSQYKAEWDQRIDAASICTLPPSHYPPGEPPDAWGPGVQVETNRPEGYGFFRGPEFNPGSREISDQIREHADAYFGRRLPDGRNAIGAQALEQDRLDKMMGAWAGVDTQILQLEQQFAPDELYFRVVGSDKGRPLHATRDEIQGEFDISISYSATNLDNETIKEKFDFINEAMQWDRGGRIDTDELLQIGFDLIDPNMGERVLKPGQQAAQGELDDEASVLTKLVAGIPVDVKPGQAFKLRLDWLQNTVAQSPKLQKMYESDEDFRALLDKRMKQLSHQVEQFGQNAQIGRLGA